jgi:hypothetical protein
MSEWVSVCGGGLECLCYGPAGLQAVGQPGA